MFVQRQFMDMDRSKLQHALKKLTADAFENNKTKQIESLFPYIETAIRAGVPHEKILAVLKTQGVDIELGYFRMILHRLRKKTGSKGKVLKKLHSPQRSQIEQEANGKHLQSEKKTVYPLTRKDVEW